MEKAFPSLFIINIDGTGVKDILKDCTEYMGDKPAISPDGKEIVFVVGVKDAGNNLMVLNLETKQVRRLTDHLGWDNDPCFSPDGKKVVYRFSPMHPTYGSMLYALNSDGTNNIRLTPMQKLKHPPYVSVDECPDWAP
jgi:TolB protein